MITALPTRTRRGFHFRRGALAVAILFGLAIVAWCFVQRVPSLEQGEAFFNAGKFDAALEIAERRLVRFPDDIDAWKLKALCLERAGDLSNAADAFAKVSERSPNDWELRYHLAMTLLQSGRLEAAEYQFRRLLEERADSESVQTELQWLLFNQMREREVETLLEGILVRQPAEFRVLYHLLASRQRHPIPQESVGLLELANKTVPGQSTVELALGRCVWKLGDPVRAMELFTLARKENSRNLETALVVAEFLFEQGDLTAADAMLAPPEGTPGDMWQNDDRWWWLRGQLAIQRQDWGEALVAIEGAVQRRPGEVRYVNAHATILRALNRAAEAAAVHERAERLADAERELYVLVSSGALEKPTRMVFRDAARHCATLHRQAQAAGWEKLAMQ